MSLSTSFCYYCYSTNKIYGDPVAFISGTILTSQDNKFNDKCLVLLILYHWWRRQGHHKFCLYYNSKKKNLLTKTSLNFHLVFYTYIHIYIHICMHMYVHGDDICICMYHHHVSGVHTHLFFLVYPFYWHVLCVYGMCSFCTVCTVSTPVVVPTVCTLCVLQYHTYLGVIAVKQHCILQVLCIMYYGFPVCFPFERRVSYR